MTSRVKFSQIFVTIALNWKYADETCHIGESVMLLPYIEEQFRDIQERTIERYIKKFDDIPKGNLEYAYITAFTVDKQKVTIKDIR